MEVKTNNSSMQMGNVRFGAFVLIVAAIVGLYWPTVNNMLVEWNTSLYSHAWLSVGLSLYYLWTVRSTAPSSRGYHWVGLVIVTFAALCWWVGTIVSIALLQYFALYSLFVGFIWLLWGWPMIWALKYMLVVLALAMPLWQMFQHPLRYVSAEMSYMVIKAMGIPVLFEDFMLMVPGGRFHVEPACAGLSFLLAATSLVFIFAAWQRLSVKQLVPLLLFSSAVAIVSNWIRIIVIVYIGNRTNMQSVIVSDHLTFGWILFALIYCPIFFMVIYKVQWVSTTASEGVLGFSQVPKPALIMAAMGVLIALGFPYFHKAYMKEVEGRVYHQKLALLESGPQVKVAATPVTASWAPVYDGATYSGTKLFVYQGIKTTLYMAEYPFQNQEAELINVNNQLYPGAWVEEDRAVVNNSEWIRLKSEAGESLIAYCYIVGGQKLIGWREAKLQQLVGYFNDKPEAYLVAVKLDRYAMMRSKEPEQFALNALEKAVELLGVVKAS